MKPLFIVFLIFPFVMMSSSRADESIESSPTPSTAAQIMKAADHAVMSFYEGKPVKRQRITVSDAAWFGRFAEILRSTQYSLRSAIMAVGTTVAFFDKDDKPVLAFGFVLGVLSLGPSDYELPPASAAKIQELLKKKMANKAPQPTPPSRRG